MYNDKKQKNIRKKLRHEATPHEEILWSRLRRKYLGFKFRRQFGVGPYILDFYCGERRVAVEIDGSQHLEEKEKDIIRDGFLAGQDITVLRFWNNEIDQNLDGVIMKIQSVLDTPQSPNVDSSPT
ncbi:MAG: DUF559 domain-containing protein [Candidatus Nomurabacteria bacterium]|nr:DUF559 domain-containing protein [Candidatus Nomurabacteria bacterium]